MADCLEKLNQMIKVQQRVFIVSIGLTLACGIVRRIKQYDFQQKPLLAVKVLGGFSVAKLTIAILLMTVFLPRCPEDCQCVMGSPYYYPIVVVLIAFYWIFLANTYLKMHRAQEKTQNQVPTIEVHDMT